MKGSSLHIKNIDQNSSVLIRCEILPRFFSENVSGPNGPEVWFIHVTSHARHEMLLL